eukprot:TRINITY_DN33259_c0_g1_i1.p1 TRINITY_DN33259_c0_g1~~TRINITY_DN33259_c0_g1_i1.p1  ORF type:complete len:195 (-),score=34.67 TRINITY_DN33259_c0_g1_i1:36-596(-)
MTTPAAAMVGASASNSSLSRSQGSMVGKCLATVLESLQDSIDDDRKEMVQQAFDSAFAEELAALPRFWKLHFAGRIHPRSLYNLGEKSLVVNIEKARVHGGGIVFQNVQNLRLDGSLAKGALMSSRKRKAAQMMAVSKPKAAVPKAAPTTSTGDLESKLEACLVRQGIISIPAPADGRQMQLVSDE